MGSTHYDTPGSRTGQIATSMPWLKENRSGITATVLDLGKAAMAQEWFAARATKAREPLRFSPRSGNR